MRATSVFQAVGQRQGRRAAAGLAAVGLVLALLLGTGGSPAAASANRDLAPSTSASDVVKNDFNGDRNADILARDGAGDLWLYPGNGSGGWLPQVKVGNGWNIMTAIIAPGDFNGDGHADILARDYPLGDLWLYPGNGSAGWMPRVQVSAGWNNQTNSLGIGDFQGDGFVDVAVSNRGGMWIERGDGKGGWLNSAWAGYGWFFGSEAIGVGDFNSDGTADVVGRDNSGVLWLYPGNGTGGWLPQSVTGAGWNAMNSLVGPGDFNGDGKNDIIARDSIGDLYLYEGSGGSAWPTSRKVGSGWNIMTEIL
ncbi:hypothetical protein J2T10_002763 [Paenarthrobacter nicotinovorans]|uniref:VCBS repeat protein n=1 Tax=Paenarthrobacter nicotinovorans TaxID=29320 RepID=A0ABT9TPV8_PAENI|nr:VCBS repeat-containing protein [Paenarthrobacter nicotinovorans]MDQ0103106.1 hypothetical protein [Paenarthrobacter nicotinovorans]